MKWSISLVIAALVLFLSGSDGVAYMQASESHENIAAGIWLLNIFCVITEDPPVDPFEVPTNMTWDIPSSYDKMHPRVVMDPSGYSHYVFMMGVNQQWEIHYGVVKPGGGSTGRKVSRDTCNSTYPAIALDSNKDAHIIWLNEEDDGSWEIYYRKMRYDSTWNFIDTVGPVWSISDTDGYNSGRFIDPYVEIDNPDSVAYIEHPDIVVDYEDNVHVVWSDARDGRWQIYYQKQTNDSIPSGSNVLIHDTRVSPLLIIPAASGYDNGGPTPPHNDRKVRRKPAIPAYFQTNPPIPSEPQEDSHPCCPTVAHSPAIDVDTFNRVHVVWQMKSKDLGAYEIFYDMWEEWPIPNMIHLIHNDARLSSQDSSNSASPDIIIHPDPHPWFDEKYHVNVVWMDERALDIYHSPIYNPPPEHPGRFEIYSQLFNFQLDSPSDHQPADPDWPKRQSDMQPPGYSTWFGVWTEGPDSCSRYPRWTDGPTSHGSPPLKTVKLAWQDNREGNWDIFYCDLTDYCHNPTPDVLISTGAPQVAIQDDMYPDIALHADCDHGYPDIKFQHWDHIGGDWDIYDAQWNATTYAYAVLANTTTGDTMVCDMYPLYPRPEAPPYTYGYSITLPNGDYTFYVKTKNISGEVATSDTLDIILNK